MTLMICSWIHLTPDHPCHLLHPRPTPSSHDRSHDHFFHMLMNKHDMRVEQKENQLACILMIIKLMQSLRHFSSSSSSPYYANDERILSIRPSLLIYPFPPLILIHSVILGSPPSPLCHDYDLVSLILDESHNNNNNNCCTLTAPRNVHHDLTEPSAE